MDDARFDRLTASLSSRLIRRRLLGSVLGTAVSTLLLWSETAIAKKKNPCPKSRRCGNGCCKKDETCKQGRCVDHCEDGEKNLGETDRDCGGTCRRRNKCDRLRTCKIAGDCQSGVCFKPFPEERPNEQRCGDCTIDGDCDNTNLGTRCINNLCQDCAANFDCPDAERPFCVAISRCFNNEPCACRECRNNGDCPDPVKKVCVNGLCKQCGDDVDCQAGQDCQNGECITRDHCSNQQIDGDETDFNCGGSLCPPCRRGRKCKVDGDCQSGVCLNQNTANPRCR